MFLINYFYLFPSSVNETCDAFQGTCFCKSNTEGQACDTCVTRTFNLDARNPDGCQPCFCYGHALFCNSSEGFLYSNILVNKYTMHKMHGYARLSIFSFL